MKTLTLNYKTANLSTLSAIFSDFLLGSLGKICYTSGINQIFPHFASRRNSLKISRKQFRNSKSSNFNRGAASLPSIIAVGLLILVVGVSITAISMSESFVSVGSSQSATALSYAELGAKDGLIRVSRNKNYSGSYSINMVSGGCISGDGCATVTVGAGVGSEADPKYIDSTGQMKTSTRKVRVAVEYFQYGGVYSGEIATSTWQEVTY